MYGNGEKRVLLVVASLASFLVPYTVSSLNVALPAISTSFGIDAVMLGWVTSAYLLTAAICIIPFGRLADIYGRKRFFILGNALFALGSLLAAISWSGPAIITARVVQALGGAMVFSTSIAIVTSVFPPGERGKAIGIITATVYAGLSLGPFIGGVLTYNIGWPSIFLVNIPLAILVIVLTVFYIPGEWTQMNERRFDLAGAALYSIMLFSCIYGLTQLAISIRYLLDGFRPCSPRPVCLVGAAGAGTNGRDLVVQEETGFSLLKYCSPDQLCHGLRRRVPSQPVPAV